MSTHNICFHGEIRKILCRYPLFSGAMILIGKTEKALIRLHRCADHSGPLQHAYGILDIKFTRYEKCSYMYFPCLFVCIPCINLF